MGEATYYFKAVFNSIGDARNNFDKIREYLRQNEECYNEWQEKRHTKQPTKTLNNLKTKYPLVFSVLKIEKATQNMNELAGNLIEITEGYNEGLELKQNEIRFSGETWHLADWQPLENFCLSLGAIKTNQVSDEYLDPWSTL